MVDPVARDDAYSACVLLMKACDDQFSVDGAAGRDDDMKYIVIKDCLLLISGMINAVSSVSGFTVCLSDASRDELMVYRPACRTVAEMMDNETKEMEMLGWTGR